MTDRHRGALLAHRDALLSLAAAYGITRVRVFGSVARGDAGNDSDIDLLVDFDATSNGVGPLAGFRLDAESLLGVPVDVATVDLLKAEYRARALSEAIDL